MYIGLLHTHSLLRWVLLVLLIITIGKAWLGWLGKQDYKSTDRRLAVFSLILAHVQLLLGGALFFLSPYVQTGDMGATMKDATLRFWTIEHTLTMLLGIILITIGRSSSRKATEAVTKHKRVALFFTIGLVLILSRIPWDRMGF